LVNATAVKLGIHTPIEFYVLLPEAQDPLSVTEEQLDGLVEAKWKSSKMTWPVFVKPMKVNTVLLWISLRLL
jgi:hypothetical protein